MKRWTEADLRTRGVVTEKPDQSVRVTGARAQKYRNLIIRADGRVFRSRLEYRRYVDLRLMEEAEAITGLECQPRFSLDVAGVHICDYVADYSYSCDGVKVVEDCKGARTLLYRAKKALMRAVHGIEIREITK
jgi:hypothetical protein